MLACRKDLDSTVNGCQDRAAGCDQGFGPFQFLASIWLSRGLHPYNAREVITKSHVIEKSKMPSRFFELRLLGGCSLKFLPMSRLSEFSLEDGDFQKGTYIGRGTFGIVYSGVYTRGGANIPVAIKEQTADCSARSQDLMRELGILATTNHPSILHLVGVKLSHGFDRGATILTPLMRRGDIWQILKNGGRHVPDLNATTKTICVFGIAVGMAYLHSRGIIHRDLKPQNVFLNDDLEPVIADFGLSRIFALQMTGSVGSPMYMAPELVTTPQGDEDRYRYTGKVDVYSYGMTVLEILSPAPSRMWDDRQMVTPQTPLQRLYQRVLNGARPERPDGVSDQYWRLITHSWDPLPTQRPSFEEIINEFRLHTEAFCLPGADVAAVRAYLNRVTQGYDFKDTTKIETDGPANEGVAKNDLSFMAPPDDD